MVFITFSFLIGIIIVFNMVLNVKATQSEGMINGIAMNYLMAAISSAILCVVMVKSIPAYTSLKAISPAYFMGGFIGVLTTYLFNLIVPNVPAVYIVVLRFVGQMFASAAIDYIYLGVYSNNKVIGGVLFLIGLIINARIDNKHIQENPEAVENTKAC